MTHELEPACYLGEGDLGEGDLECTTGLGLSTSVEITLGTSSVTLLLRSSGEEVLELSSTFKMADETFLSLAAAFCFLNLLPMVS